MAESSMENTGKYKPRIEGYTAANVRGNMIIYMPETRPYRRTYLLKGSDFSCCHYPCTLDNFVEALGENREIQTPAH